jgi:hypothetical protein
VGLTSVSPSNITHSSRTPVRFKLDTPRVAPDHDVSCIAMAHGYRGAIFDYRGFGASTGEPGRANPAHPQPGFHRDGEF